MEKTQEQNRYVYGVFRSMGMPYRTLCRKLFVQYVTGIVFAWLFACYAVEKVFGYRFTAGQVVLCMGFLLFFSGSCYAVLYGVYKKQPFAKCCRKSDVAVCLMITCSIIYKIASKHKNI